MPDSVSLVDKDGNAHDVPADLAGAFVAQGWTPETDDHATERIATDARREMYGGVGGAVAAGAAGLARGVTMGGSDVAARALFGRSAARALAGYQEENPTISGVANVIGAIAPALVGDEAGLAGLTPSGFTARIGSRIAEGGSIARTAAAGAFEGAAQNAGSYVSDVALGNRDLSAEGFTGAMGQGALYGGVAGGALSVASHGLIAARRLFPAEELTPEAVAGAKFAARRAVSDSVDTSTGLETAGRQAVSDADRETQQFVEDLNHSRAEAMEQAAKARTIEERGLASSQPYTPVGQATETASLETERAAQAAAVPPKDARQLMAAWREKYPVGAVELDAASAASRRQRMADWAKDFEAKTPEDATIKAYFSNPMDPARTTDRVGIGGTPKAVQDAARKAAAEASHAAYLDATAAGANVSKSGPELMARATYAGRRAAAQAMDDVYAAYAAGKPLVDIRAAATQRLTGHLHELAEARADMIQSLAKTPEAADDLMAKLQGTKTGLDAGRPLSLGERILEGVQRPIDPDVAVANALGKSKDVNEDIASIAPKITRYEAAKAAVTESLGEKASPDAVAHAQQFRAAQQTAAHANAAATARTVESIDASARGVPAEHLPSGKPRIGGLSKIADFGASYEMLRTIGVPLPDPKSIPVIGPILSAFLKAKMLLKFAGKSGGSFAATAEGTIAAKAVETQNRIRAAVGQMVDSTATGISKRAGDLGGAAALGYKLFDDGKKKPAPYSSAPSVGELGDLYRDRLDELSSAMQPGAISQAVKSRINTSDPTILDAIIASETRKLQYLYSAAPKPDSIPLPGHPPQLPSRAEMLTFGNVVAAAHDPSAIFERVAQGGNARPNEIDCVRNCYPQLFAQAQRKLIDLLSKADAPQPYLRRVAISSLLGIPMDQTMIPAHAAYLQAASVPAPAPPSAPHPALTSSVSIGDRTLTRLDR